MHFILKHGSKQKKPFLREFKVGYTGIDLSYGIEKHAMPFISMAVAVNVSKALAVYGNFYPVEVNE